MKHNEEGLAGVLVADIGGSHITSAICCGQGNVDHNSVSRVEFSSKTSAQTILESWCLAMHKSIAAFGGEVTGVGLAMPGPFDYENGICYLRGLNKYEAMYGMNIRQTLAGRLNIQAEKFRFRNDAEATIAGEVLYGTAVDSGSVLGITLGTGFGSAFFDGQTTRDINLGSEPFKETIADDYLSTRWFQRRSCELTGLSLTGGVRELASMADSNLTAKAIFREFACNLTEFLGPYVTEYRPRSVLICGNIAKASKHFLTVIKKRLEVPLIMAGLGEHAALMGASGLFTATEGTIMQPSGH